MRVRCVGGPLSVLLIVCLVSSNSIVRVRAYDSESNEGKNLTNIPDDILFPDDDQEETSKLKEISSTAAQNNEYDIKIREAAKSETDKAKQQLIPTESSVSKREKIFGIPQESAQATNNDMISEPLNKASDLLRSDPTAGENSSSVSESDQKKSQQGESSARTFGSGLFNAGSKPASSSADSTQTAVPPEDLPTIIEKNEPVDPNKPPTAASLDQTPASYANSSTGMQLPGSSARTFDSWTNCIGSTSNKYGTCKNDVECEKFKGKADGSCMGGLGVCCVMALSCNDKSIENNTFFANPDFPEPSWEARQCQVELTKKSLSVVQIMIEFDEFELAPPNSEGECITDVFQIRLASNKPSPYSLLRICGHNTGQHLYLDVSQIDEPLVLSIATSGGGFPRRWSIRIVQMDHKNHLLAPPGCLQYYTDTVGHFRSFNLGKNLRNLYYAICFRIDNGYSGIRFTSNFFGMNGPVCRRRIGKQPGGLAAHPHHLVIPPPGSAIPLPKPYGITQEPPQYLPPPQQSPYQPQQPNYQPTTLGPKYKRSVQPMQQVGLGSQPMQNQGLPLNQQAGPQSNSGARTLSHLPGFGMFGSSSDKEAKLESKEFEHDKHHKQYQHYPSPPPSPYYPTSYGPPPQIIYGGEPGKSGLGGEKAFLKEHEHHKPEHFGWKGEEEVKYGEGYGQPMGYHHKEMGKYGEGYGPPMGYHHKEIGKFGEKYEHLHEKHEKNHHHGKDEKTGSGWWPNFGFLNSKDKEDKKNKEKFFMHHEALFPLVRMPEMPHCDPRYCGSNDVITFPPSGDSIAEMCGNSFNRGRGPKIISGSPLVVYVSNRGHQRGSGFDMNYEQVFYIPKPY